MAVFFLFALQAAATLAELGIPADFDLRKLPEHEEKPLDLTGSRHCRSEDGTEIVVCAHRSGEQRHRLRALPDAAYASEPMRAEMSAFGNSKVAVETDSVTMVGSAATNGLRSNRSMIRSRPLSDRSTVRYAAWSR
ncbi:MAG: hypothetical protein ACO1O3_02225 [Sphingobium sp.]